MGLYEETENFIIIKNVLPVEDRAIFSEILIGRSRARGRRDKHLRASKRDFLFFNRIRKHSTVGVYIQVEKKIQKTASLHAN